MTVDPSMLQRSIGNAANANEWAQAAGQQGSLGYASTGNDGYVWMGSDYEPTLTVGSTYGPSKGSAVWSVQQAQEEYFRLDDAQYSRWVKSVSENLGWDVSKDWNRAKSTWDSTVLNAAAYQKSTGQKISPFEFLEMTNARNARLGLAGNRGGGASGYSKVVSLSNPQDARVLVDNALTEYLGRAATEEESAQFLKVLNAQERANPNVNTPGSQSGGVNREQIAKEFGRSRKDAAEFMADTQYMDWFMNKIAADPTEEIASGL